MTCVECEQPIREVLTSGIWVWEHTPEISGWHHDHPADPGSLKEPAN